MYTVKINNQESKTLQSAAKFVRSGKADKAVDDARRHYFENFLDSAKPNKEFHASTSECRGAGTVLAAFARSLKGDRAEAAKKLARELRY